MVLFSAALSPFSAVALGVPPRNSRALAPRLCGTRDSFCERQFFHGPSLGGGWFGDDSSPLCLLFTLFLNAAADLIRGPLPGSWGSCSRRCKSRTESRKEFKSSEAGVFLGF